MLMRFARLFDTDDLGPTSYTGLTVASGAAAVDRARQCLR